MKSRTIFLLVSTLAAANALAQLPSNSATGEIGNPGNKSPSGMPADTNFMKTLAQGGMAEVDAGKLATTKATNSDVKKFAQQMVKDHSKNNDKLKSLAKDKKVELPTMVDAEHAADKEKLEKQSGASFDTTYIQGQVKDHQKTVQLLEHEIDGGQDADVKAFAKETLPVVQHHLEMAKELNTKVAHEKQ